MQRLLVNIVSLGSPGWHQRARKVSTGHRSNVVPGHTDTKVFTYTSKDGCSHLRFFLDKISKSNRRKMLRQFVARVAAVRAPAMHQVSFAIACG